MMKQRIQRLIFAVAALTVLPAALAQSGAGKIQGTVRDASGAVIAGATVTAEQPASGQKSEGTTNSDGFYVIPSLFTDQYAVHVTSPGMEEWQGNVTLQVNQTAVINVTLKVAGTNQKIEVDGDVTPLVTTDSPAIGATIEHQRIEQLPENGRSIPNLVGQTTPGIEGQIANGLTFAALEWTQDGASLESRDASDPPQAPPDPDTIQEVHIETSNASAKYDRPATVVLSTRSGTNHLHGSAFETNRDNSYGVAKNRQDTFTTAPKLVRNEYGISMGGPVFLPFFSPQPKLYNGKDKTFFFGAYEKLSLRQDVSMQLFVPTLAMRQGIFTGVTNSAGQAVTLYDNQTTTASNPWTRQPFQNNVIPMSRISPLAKTLYAVTPAPTNAANPYASPNFTGTQPADYDRPAITARLDQHFTERSSAYARFSHSNADATQAGASSSPEATDQTWNLQVYYHHTDGLAIGWNYSISPTLFNEVIVSMNYENDGYATGIHSTDDLTTALGIPNPFGIKGVPVIDGTATGGSVSSTLMSYVEAAAHRKAQLYNNLFDDNVTWLRGHHQFLFGARYRHERSWLLDNQSPPASLNFGNTGSAIYDPKSGGGYSPLNNTGLATADFFLGDGQTYANAKFANWLRLRDQEISGYFVDDFRVRTNLTANLGLRYTAHPATTEKDNQYTSFDLANHAVVLGAPLTSLYAKGLVDPKVVAGIESVGIKFETPAEAGLPNGVVSGQKALFAPRLGLAYQPFGARHSLVLRGGYGVYHFLTPARAYYGSQNGQAPFVYNYTVNYSSAAYSPDGLGNYLLRYAQNGAPIQGTPSGPPIAGLNTAGLNTTSLTSFVPGTNFTAIDRNLGVNTDQEWNFTMEHQLPGATLISISYLGNHGSGLAQTWEYNSAPSAYVYYATTGLPLPTGTYANVATRPYDNTAYGNISIIKSTGWSNTNGLQAEIQHPYKKGYAFQLFYVMTNAFWTANNTSVTPSSSIGADIQDAAAYLPGLVPTDDHARNRFEMYSRNITIPRERIRFNWVLDLPLGRGKAFLSKSNRLVDAIVGGWQVAGVGQVGATYFQPSTTQWGPTSQVQVYGRKHPVTDCRSGICYKAYLGFNGYLPPTQINTASGVSGIPGDYTPALSPIIPIPPGGGSKSDPNYPYYNTNDVFVKLANGTTVVTGYNPGPTGVNPYSKSYYQGPFNWTTDASIAKLIPIKDSVRLRFTADAFNVFNDQGTNNPGAGDGIIVTTKSANTARILQLTARLSW